MDQPKLERLLRLMKLLTANTTYNVDQLAERLRMSRRTVYRYIDTFREAGFDAVFTGQKTYNGVALVTRKSTVSGLEAVELNIPGYPDDQKRFVSALITPAAGGDPIRFCGAYFPNGQEIGTSKYLYKLDWISTLSRHLKKLLEASPRLILGGDFNIAPAEADTWNPAYWEGKILCSPAERGALKRLEALGLRDSFRLFSQPAETFSWWDYRQSGFEKNHGLRIDLMLVSDALVPLVKEAAIDASNVMLVCPKCKKGVRVGYSVLENGTKVRVCKKCGASIED